MRTLIATWVLILLMLSGCAPAEPDSSAAPAAAAAEEQTTGAADITAGRPARLLPTELHTQPIAPEKSAERKALFGDLHIHTVYSFDAFAFGTLATPSDAYRFAKGEAIMHPAGFEVQLPAPLDFYGVTDHAMFMGVVPAAADTSTEFSKLPMSEPFHNLNRADNLNIASGPDRGQRFSTFIPNILQGILDGSISRDMIRGITRTAWQDSIAAAEAHNDPGNFTTFVAYEYTSSTNERGNLHRNVVFRSGDRVPEIPFSRFHSQNPEGLWRWMDDLRAQGIDSVAIPHNSNGSNGAMFMLTDWAGEPIDSAYAGLRMRNEPLVEVTQVKGTSDTHPLLSPNDEWADFEIMPYRVAHHAAQRGERQLRAPGLSPGTEDGSGDRRQPLQVRPDRLLGHPHRCRLFRGG